MASVQTAIEEAAARIRAADGLVITAGAGLGIDAQAVASPAAFRAQPRHAWAFYGHRLARYRSTRPHDGFHLLRRWGERMPRGYTVFTSNVDGQFELAGFDAARIHECHGSIHVLQCLAPCSRHLWAVDGFEPDVDEQASVLRGELPRCPHCQGLARPNVLMFGDGEWIDTRAAAQDARQRAWLARVQQPVVVELGAETALPSVRLFAETVGHRHGAARVKISPCDSAFAGADDVAVPLGAVAALTAIDAVLERLWR